MKCPSCGGENPEAARFCQMCGKLVAPGYQYEQVQAQNAATPSVPAPSPQEGSVKQSNLALATVLIIVGVSVVALSRVVTGGSGSHYYGERDFFLSIEVNCYIVVAAGVGMMIYDLSRGRALTRPESEVPQHATEESFFHRMNPSAFSGAVYGTQARATVPEAHVSTGIRALLYLLSICIPAAGSVAGTIIYTNAKPEYKRVGKMCMMLSAVGLVVIFALGVWLFVVILPSNPHAAVLGL